MTEEKIKKTKKCPECRINRIAISAEKCPLCQAREAIKKQNGGVIVAA